MPPHLLVSWLLSFMLHLYLLLSRTSSFFPPAAAGLCLLHLQLAWRVWKIGLDLSRESFQLKYTVCTFKQISVCLRFTFKFPDWLHLAWIRSHLSYCADLSPDKLMALSSTVNSFPDWWITPAKDLFVIHSFVHTYLCSVSIYYYFRF